MGLGDERLQNRRFPLGDFRTERLKVKADRGPAICQGLLVGISFAHDHALQTQWISHVAVGMFFNDDFPSFHGGMVNTRREWVKRHSATYFAGGLLNNASDSVLQ